MSLVKKISLYSFLALVVFSIGLIIAEIWFDVIDDATLTKILMTVGLVVVLDVIILAVLRDVKQEDDQTDKNLIQ